MKNVFKIAAIMLAVSMMFSCTMPNSGSSDEDDKIVQAEKLEKQFSEGWWYYKSVNYVNNTKIETVLYILYDKDKNIERMGTDKVEYEKTVLDSVKASNSWLTLKRASEESDSVYFYLVNEANVPTATWETNSTKNPQDVNPARKDASLRIDSTLTLATGNLHILPYIECINIYADDDLELVIQSNNDKLNITSTVKFNEYTLKCDAAGSMYFYIYDKTANCKSNICYVTFKNEPAPNPVDDKSSIDPLLVGTWNVTTTGLLFNTIEFYADGTGKSYNSNYSGANTFKWQITGVGEFTLTNSIGQSNTTTYSLNGTTLSLTNFFSPKDVTIYATKS